MKTPPAYRDLYQQKMRTRVIPSGMTVVNADGGDDGPAVVRLYGEIDQWWGISAEEVAAQLEQITAAKIEVQIASLGGSVFDGIAIYNALRSHPAHVTTRVDSMAASIASVIVQAGDDRVMLTGSQMMIHEAWSIGFGTAQDMRDLADILDMQTGIIADIYAERTGKDRDHFLGLMSGETWMTADAAVDAGLADRVVKPPADTKNRVGLKFSERAAAVVTAVEALVAETGEVVTFREATGKKQPLAEDSVEILQRLATAVDDLMSVVSPTGEDGTTKSRVSLAEYTRYLTAKP